MLPHYPWARIFRLPTHNYQNALRGIEKALEEIYYLAQGGTAGTGIKY